jgi:putative glutamine amidotransferase
MRIGQSANYKEIRDCLAHDWPNYMANAFPAFKWLMIPNLGKESSKYAADWNVDIIILTGGNDIGAEPRRDQSEMSLIDYAIQHHLPLLGVCRGMQLLNKYMGGESALVAKEKHVACMHQITLSDKTLSSTQQTFKVNSYHNYGIKMLAKNLKTVAHDEDGKCEAFADWSRHILGLMWHPERAGNAESLERLLFKKWLETT